MESNLHQLLRSAKRNEKNQNYEQALEDLDRANQISPNNPTVLKHRGNIRRLLGDADGGLVDVNRADELQPNDYDTLRYRGAIKRKLCDYAGALEDLNNADRMLPNNAFILRHRGAAKRFHPVRDLEGSLEDLRNANQLSPNDAFTLQHLGATLRALGFYADSVLVLQEANRLKPQQALTLRHLGAALRALSYYQAALQFLNDSITLDPDHAFARKQRALTHAQLLNFQEAWQDACRAHELDPQSSEARRLRDELDVMRRFAASGDEIMRIPYRDLEFTPNIILGFGGSGYVRPAEWHALKVAVKTVLASSPNANLTHEAKALFRLRHKHIIGLIAVSTDPETGNLQIVMEYAKHGSLRDLLHRDRLQLTNGNIIQLALDIAKALTYLHAQTPKVIHRDLKSENILLFDNRKRAKISDFGTVKFAITQVHHATVVGAVGIPLPPEMLDETAYDEKVDIFSFGVVLQEMLLSERRALIDIGQIQQLILPGDLRSDLFQIVLECCQPNPRHRPSAQQLVQRLKILKNRVDNI